MPEELEAMDVFVTLETFEGWLADYENQPFYSLQEAYRRWLDHDGYGILEGDYSHAVAVLLVYLSRAAVNPNYRRYYADPEDQGLIFATLQVTAAHDDEDLTHWEFLTEANFRKGYAAWQPDPKRWSKDPRDK